MSKTQAGDDDQVDDVDDGEDAISGDIIARSKGRSHTHSMESPWLRDADLRFTALSFLAETLVIVDKNVLRSDQSKPRWDPPSDSCLYNC